MCVRPGPAFSVADVARGWVNGLREAGCDVVDLNYDDRITAFDRLLTHGLGDVDEDERFHKVMRLASQNVMGDLYAYWPHVIVIISGFYVPPSFYKVARDRGHKVVLVCTESPYEDEFQMQRAPYCDVVIVNDPTNLDAFRALNEHSYYFPHCYDPAIHIPGSADADLVCDFSFVGTGYPSRIEFLEQVDWSGISLSLAGNWQKLTLDSPLRPHVIHPIEHCIDNTEAVRLYRSSKVSANLYRKEATGPEWADGWAMGPREVELAATGSFFVREPRGEGDEVFPFLPTFTEPAELEQLVRHYMRAHDERDALVEKARAAIVDRTFINNAKRLLSLL